MLCGMQGELKSFLFKELVHALFYTEIVLRVLLGFGIHIRVMHGLGNVEEATNIGSEKPSGRLLKLFSQTTPKPPASSCFLCQDSLHMCGGFTPAKSALVSGGQQEVFPFAYVQSALMHMFAEPEHTASFVQPCALMLAVFNGVPENTQGQMLRAVVLNTRAIQVNSQEPNTLLFKKQYPW